MRRWSVSVVALLGLWFVGRQARGAEPSVTGSLEPGAEVSDAGVASPPSGRTGERAVEAASVGPHSEALSDAIAESVDAVGSGERRALVAERTACTPPPLTDAAPGEDPDAAGHLALDLAGTRLVVRGLAQVDAILASQASFDELDASTGQPLNEQAVALRRARVRLEASRWLFALHLELEASTSAGLSVRPSAADVSARWPLEGVVPLVELRAGLLRVPFGLEVRSVDALERLFFEPTVMAQALFPGAYDLGVRLTGGWRFLRYDVAVMNGEPAGEKTFPAMDPHAGKDVLGRLGVAARRQRVGLAGGVSTLWGAGFHAGSPATKDTLAWRDVNEDGKVQSTELQVVGGLPATPSKSFRRFALGADAEVTVDVPMLGRLAASGEVLWASNLDRGLFVADPVATGQDVRELGWSLVLTQQLPLGFTAGVRLDGYLPDADAAEQQGAVRVPVDSRLTTWSVVAGWRWRRTVRLLAEYRHQTNALGRGLDGAPATLGSDRLALRAEVAF